MNESREVRLEAILHAYLQAVDRGERPDRQKVLDDNPDLREDLAEYFADASKLDRMAESLKTASFQGGRPQGGQGFEPPSPEELAGRFPQLEVLELLGKGGMGAVYKARHKGLDRLVAVKILPPEISRDAAFAERFTREARALAKLNHPNIVAVYDFGQTTEGLFFFVMEFVDGVNLRQALRTGGIASKEALAIVPQVCDALQYAHDEGIVHRDIKPENILIDKKGRVKIADFGLAKLLGRSESDLALTGTHQVMGTLRYMAPEQMEGSKQVDHRADIYSLGVVFYELLTGELPMGRFAPPSKKVQIDVRLDEVVLRALEKEPEQRWQQASEVKTEVEAIKATRTRQPESIEESKKETKGIAAGRLRLGHWSIVGIVFSITLAALLWHFWLWYYHDAVPPGPSLVAFLALNELMLVWASIQSIRARLQADIPLERRVRGPALAMLIFGGLGCALGFGVGMVVGVVMLFGHEPPSTMPIRVLVLIFSIFCFVSRLLTIIAGFKLLGLRSRGLGIASSVLMMLPTDPLALVGIPLGIWALLTLLREDVVAELEKRRPKQVQKADSLVLSRWYAWKMTAISLTFYALSFTQIAYFHRSSIGAEDTVGSVAADHQWRGWECFQQAWQHDHICWYANPLLWLGYVLLILRRWSWATLLGLAAFAAAVAVYNPLGVSFYFRGFWLWVASIAVLAGSGAYGWRHGGEAEEADVRWKPEEWRNVAKPLRLFVHIVLAVVYFGSLLMFFSYRDTSTTLPGDPSKAVHDFQVGGPTPWLVFRSEGIDFHFNIYFLTWSNLVAMVGLAALATIRKLEEIEKGKTHPLWWHGAVWTFLLFIALGIGIFSTFMHAKKVRDQTPRAVAMQTRNLPNSKNRITGAERQADRERFAPRVGMRNVECAVA